MAMTNFSFPAFDVDCDSQSAGPRWRKWLERFENYLVAMNIKADSRQKAMLLYFGGERLSDIWDTLKAPDNDDDFAAVKTKLTTHFAPQVNTLYEVYVFRNTRQTESETVDQFCT